MRVVKRASLAAVAALTLGAGALVAAPAYATPVTTTIAGITYEADDSTISAGATVTGFDGSTTTVTIPDTVEINGSDYDVVRIGIAAFQIEDGVGIITRGPITTVVIGDNVESIDIQAFNFASISSLTLGASVQSIAGSAFKNNFLTQVTIPATVTYLGGAAFLGNPELASVVFEGPAPEVRGTEIDENNRTFDLSVPGFMISYSEQYGADNVADGFTTPEWRGYPAEPIGDEVPAAEVSITKTVDASFVRVYDWEFEKTGTLGEVTVGADDASADIDFTVTATPNGYADNYYVLDGTITVTNETSDPVTVDVTDVPDVGTTASCDVYDSNFVPAEGVVLEPSDSVTFEYRCELDGVPAGGTNTATVSWGDDESASVTEDVVFTQRDTSFETITVGDDHASPDDGYTELGTAWWNSDRLSFVFDYTLTAENLPLGECTSVTNTAMIFEMELTANATVEVCAEAAAVTPEPAAPEPTSLAQTGADLKGGFVPIALLLLLLAGGTALLLSHRTRHEILHKR